MKRIVFFFFCFVGLLGCAEIREVREGVLDFPKVVWGNSTRALEKARAEAISKTYQCSFEECFDFVVAFGEEWEDDQTTDEETTETDSTEGEVASLEQTTAETPKTKGQPPFSIFFKNRVKRHIVVIHVLGSVDSTEVGIFFSELEDGRIKIDVSSLSSAAKRSVATSIFKELDKHYSEASL